MTNQAHAERDTRAVSMIEAAEKADWQQVVLNGGPPCFALVDADGTFCLRAERWMGHGTDHHEFVSLAHALKVLLDDREARERALRVLVEGWRKSSQAIENAPRDYRVEPGEIFKGCADELEDALKTALPAEPECPTCSQPLGGSFPTCAGCQLVEALKRGD